MSRVCQAIDQKINPEAVTAWNEEKQRNVCGLCGSADVVGGYGLAGGGGCGAYNYCGSCHRILDKTEDRE